MWLSKRFHEVLVRILQENSQLEAGASRLEADRVIARVFNVSTETARNWRRGVNSVVSPRVLESSIAVCEKIAPAHVAELRLIERLSGGVQKIKSAADELVEELSEQVLSRNSTWHIYSGPLKVAHDQRVNKTKRQRLAREASLIARRILELGIDRVNIPCVGELIRYSVHGWFSEGMYDIRRASMSSEFVGVLGDAVSTVEKALYYGDGCAMPSLLLGNYRSAQQYLERALSMLDDADRSEPSCLEIRDARLILRAIQVIGTCFYEVEQNSPLLDAFFRDYDKTQAETEWAESLKHEAMGFVVLRRYADSGKAANHFDLATSFADQWLARFGVVFSSTSFASLSGYASLRKAGPTEHVKAQILDGVVRSADPGFVHYGIQAHLCLALFHAAKGETAKAHLQAEKSRALAHEHNMTQWYKALIGVCSAGNILRRLSANPPVCG